MSVELDGLIKSLEALGNKKATRMFTRIRDELRQKEASRASTQEDPATKEESTAKKILAGVRYQYEQYTQASPSIQQALDEHYASLNMHLSPKLAFRLQPVGMGLSDESELQVMRSEQPIPDEISDGTPDASWLQEIRTLPTEPRRRITMGISALNWAGYNTVGSFRNASDIELLKVRQLGKQGIVFFQHVLGSNRQNN